MSRKQKVWVHWRGYDKKGNTLSICMNVSKTENSANQLMALTEVEARTCKMTKGVIGNPKNRNQTCICMFLWAGKIKL